MGDAVSERYGDLLEGSYDCVDRIVLNAYNTLCDAPPGFRYWWRQLTGSDATLDNAHLMRMAGRFSRRVRGFAKAHAITVVDCLRGERKHDLAEEYLATHPSTRGLFMILVARAVASVWDVQQAKNGIIVDLVSKKAYVNHYSFHILDPDWGHLTIKMSGHPPFGAQIILNGHEYVAAQAAKAGITTQQEGNCFTHLANPTALASIAGCVRTRNAVRLGSASGCGGSRLIAPTPPVAPRTPRPTALGRGGADRPRTPSRSGAGGSGGDRAVRRGPCRSGPPRQRSRSRASDSSVA